MATLTRRRFISQTSMTAAALAAFSRFSFADDQPGDALIPFLDKQPEAKTAHIHWEDLTDWITPGKNFFDVSHYNRPKIDAADYKLSITGLVEKPLTLTLDQIKARPKKELIATLECSGNGAGPTFMGAIGNAKWTGTPLAPLLKEASISPDAIEAAFWGADKGKEKIRNADYDQNFARSLSLADCNREDILLAYEMNGEPLTQGHGFPLRLIVPGWYGVAWVKWLTTIELRDHRLMNRFMARDYVTIRGVQKGDQVEWKESSVGPLNPKSIAARAVKCPDGTLLISGAAWTDGTPLKAVEIKIDDGPWTETKLDAAQHATHAWTFWSFAWKDPKPGEHTLVSRAVDTKGRVQPSAEDPAIKLKKTYYEANAQYPRRIKL